MKTLFQFAAFTLLLGTANVYPEPIPQNSWQKLDSETLSDSWSSIFSALAEPARVQANFTETRTFSFRKKPIEIAGILTFTRDSGLMLHYQDPQEEIIHIDDEGVQVSRNGNDVRTRRFKGEESTGKFLLTLFRFQISELEELFEIYGKQSGKEWSMQLLPRNPDNTPIEQIEFSGSDGDLSKIEFKFPRSRRVEIELSNPEYLPSLRDQ